MSIKKFDVAEIYQHRHCLERECTVQKPQTHLVLVSCTLVLQKKKWLTNEDSHVITVVLGLGQGQGEDFVLRLEVLDPAAQPLHLDLELLQL